jgi:hypothetical protein
MDILIKSYNRPFYLDRCIFSIYQFVTGDFSITVLDDGTPEKYLKKIQEKFPDIIIRKSDHHEEKSNAIIQNLSAETEINGFQIPIDLWIDSVKNASDYFIITEDDVWFTEYTNLQELQNESEKRKINLVKLGWLGNHRDDIYTNSLPISNNLEALQPKNRLLGNKTILEAYFYNHFKFYSLLYKLKLVNHFSKDKYWNLNSILMGLYKKEYWLEIWNGMDGKVDEKRQLINAAVYYKKHRKNPNFISRLKKEAMKTTFQSSATNSYHQYGYQFDVNLFNHLINEAWYKGQFDALENFPKDFSLSYCEEFVKNKINIEEYRKWVAHFKKQYKNLGATVE